MFNLLKYSRAILITTSITRHARPKSDKSKKPPPIIKEYPAVLQLKHPSYDLPLIHKFGSEGELEDFLGPKQFLVDPNTSTTIHRHQIYLVDPMVTYDVVGPGLPRGKDGLTREQVWDRVFERKTAAALKDALEKEGDFVELPRVVKDPATGLDVCEWELILKDNNDGTIIFLETKYRMSKEHIETQSERLRKSLRIIGNSNFKIYLAAYYWPDDKGICMSYAKSLGYGIIQPNGSDLTVDAKAKELCL